MEKLCRLVERGQISKLIDFLRKVASLDSVEIAINNRCNLGCRHCSYAIHSDGRNQLNLESWLKVVQQLIQLGMEYLHICGKEPLLCDWLPDFLQELDKLKAKHKFKYGLVTNGTHLSERLDALSSSRIDYVDVSVDGLQREHDYLRGSGVFHRVRGNIEEALEALGMERVNLASVVCSHNAEEIPRMIDLFHRMGVGYFFLQPVQIAGRARKNPQLRVSEKAFLELVRCLASRKVDGSANIEVYVDYKYKSYFFDSCRMFRRTCKSRQLQELPAFTIPMGRLQLTYNWNCQAFWRSCMITPDGQLLGCSYQATEAECAGPCMGSVTDVPVKTLFRTSLDNECLNFFQSFCYGENVEIGKLEMGIIQCPVEAAVAVE